MSIKRIESAYANCFGREDVDGTAMAVLISLAYCENEKEKRCFPSVNYVSELSHFKRQAVMLACKRLKKAGLISWTSGGRSKQGNFSNRYAFSFGYKKLSSRYEHYMLISEDLSSDKCNVTDTLVRQTDTPSPSNVLSPSTKCTTLVHQMDSNSENKPKNNSENNAEVSAAPITSLLESCGFKLGSAMKRRDKVSDDQLAPTDLAMRICGVSGSDQKKAFSLAMMPKDINAIKELLHTFGSEVRQGKYKNERNLAKVLKSRIQDLPNREK